jgi:hypothetical protein
LRPPLDLFFPWFILSHVPFTSMFLPLIISHLRL